MAIPSAGAPDGKFKRQSAPGESCAKGFSDTGSIPVASTRKRTCVCKSFFNDINPLRGFAIYALRAILTCGQRYACGRDRIYIISHSAQDEYIAICVSKNIASSVREIFRLIFRGSESSSQKHQSIFFAPHKANISLLSHLHFT